MQPPPYGEAFLEWLRAGSARAGVRWTNDLDDAAIDELEHRYAIRFRADHRLFLRVLHVPEPRDPHGFYDWRRDEARIHSMLAWPTGGLVFDVEHNALWPASWGPRPASASTRAERVAELVRSAPPLVPIFGHRYTVGGTPIVLSVYQSDIIVYGNDLGTYLVNEVGAELGLERAGALTDADPSAIPFWGELIA